jgi:hypothetical protein
MIRPLDPVEYVQWRTDCTGDDITAWRAAMYERIRVTAGPAAPCLGCGRPIEGFSVPVAVDPRPVAMFEPCGCQLRIRTPPIFDHIPDGTVVDHGEVQYVTDELLVNAVNPEAVLEHLKARLIHKLGRRPDALMLVDRDEAATLRLPIQVPDDAKALVALVLRARPGTTKWIVVRGCNDMPPGFMPPGLDGRWQERARISHGLIAFLVDGLNSTATAHASGRVEIREDGAIAEVYEMRQP